MQSTTSKSYKIGHSDGCCDNPVYDETGIEDIEEYKRGYNDGLESQSQYLADFHE